MSTTNTPNLDLLRIQETWQFGDEAFNTFIDDADDKLVGVAHLSSPAHWKTWEKNTSYAKEDIIRITNGKTHQYYQCIVGGTSGTSEPTNNVTGSIITDGTVQWMVMSLSEAGTNGGSIKIWLSGTYYNRGDAVLYGTALYRCKVDHTATAWSSDYIYWQEIMASVRLWKPSTYYFIDDSVIENGMIYQCNTAHTSASVFNASEESNWDVLSGAGGAKDWLSGVSYKVGQFVISDGLLYRAIVNHTSGSSFSSDIANWEPINANIVEWTAGNYYPVGALVQNNNILYKCINSHTASSVDFDTDRADWELFHVPSAFIYNWATNTYYYDGQFVLYNSSLYKCNTSHTSTSFSSDDANWDIVYSSLLQWVANKYYKVGSVVIYNNNIYKCITANSDNPSFVPANWVRLTNVIVNNWASSVKYENNELVLNNGILYRANTLHTSGSTFISDIAKWDIVYSSIPLWVTNTNYKVGAVVIHNNAIYRCITDNNDSSFDPTKWDKITVIHVDDWASSTKYVLYEEVLYDGVLYRANVAHTSSSAFSTDSAKWDIVYANIRMYADNTFYKLNSDVVYDGKIYRCINEHTSNSYSIKNYLVYSDLTSFVHMEYNWTYPIYYDFDIGSIERIKEITFGTSGSGGNAKFIDIDCYASEDGVTYKLVGRLRGNSSYDIAFKMDVNARYFRLEFINVWFSVQVRGTDAKNLRVYKQNTNWELLSGRESMIFSWESGKDYDIDNVVVYNNILYRCVTAHVSSVFGDDRDNWELLNLIPLWESNAPYKVGNVVIYGGRLYRCNTANSSTTFSITDWDYINGVDTWESNKFYPLHTLAVYNGELYRCIASHNSSASFSPVNWELLSGSGGGSGSGTGYSQVEAIGVTASLASPYKVDIAIESNNTHTLPPTDVLKKMNGDYSIEKMLHFDSADSTKFSYDSKYVKFEDSFLQLNRYTDVTLNESTPLGGNFLILSDDIDLSDFKSIDGLVVT